MKPFLLWIALGVLLLAGFAVFRSRDRTQLNVEPHAAEEIEKAKGR